MKKRAVLSLSGGMDSTSLLLHLLAEGYSVRAYAFDYGQRHSVELERCSNNIALLKSKIPTLHSENKLSFEVIDLRSVFSTSQSTLKADATTSIPTGHYEQENMKQTVVENRNAIFSAIIYGKALSWAKECSESEEVVISLGIHSGDHAIYPDCRQEFRDALYHAFSIGNWGSEKVKFYTPYISGSKATILRDLTLSCEKVGIPSKEILINTNTCYSPDEEGRACGRCGSCIERLEAFIKVSIIDPVAYVDGWSKAAQHAVFVLSKTKKN